MQGVGCYYIFCKNTCVCEVNKLERRFYLVDAEVLPEVFLKVVKAKELLASGEVRSISAATRSVDLSRSAFYKYKDCIFDSENGREVVTVMATLRDETGALQSLLAGVVAEGTGQQAAPAEGTAAGKTGTAQTGQFREGEELKNYWFAGFYPADRPRWTIVVMQDAQTEPEVSSAAVFARLCDALAAGEDG